ncbi:MAG: DUF6263 family protein [Bacteroidia bacterium]
MKKLLLIPSVLLVTLATGCGTGDKNNDSKITLSLKPEKGKALDVNYWFSVNNTSTGDMSSFEMKIKGSSETDENGKIALSMTNDEIKMTGKISGKEVNGSAEGPDTLTGDAKLVALPVFALLHKTYRAIYDAQMDKKGEVQIAEGNIIDSTENKMQFMLRYPKEEIAVGDSWERQIVIRTGNKMNCSAKYTLKKIQGDTAFVSMDGQLSGGGDKFGNEYTMEGKIGGDFEVSIKTGLPFESDTHQEFVLKMAGKETPIVYDIKCKVR